jgi:hypothetical protein
MPRKNELEQIEVEQNLFLEMSELWAIPMKIDDAVLPFLSAILFNARKTAPSQFIEN